MSGGPIITKCGEVAGVNESTMQNNTIGLAIASAYAKEVADAMMLVPTAYASKIARLLFLI